MCRGIGQKTHHYMQLGSFHTGQMCDFISRHHIEGIFMTDTDILTQYSSLHKHLRQNPIKYIC